MSYQEDDHHCLRIDRKLWWEGVADILEVEEAAWDLSVANIAR